MLVLLVIFMVTAPMMQRGVDVKLPTSRRASASTPRPWSSQFRVVSTRSESTIG
jgi:biopolymer transport protein ExbD